MLALVALVLACDQDETATPDHASDDIDEAIGEDNESSTGADLGDAGAGPPVDPGEGPLLPAPAGEWQWLDVDGASCRDGSPAGFGYSYGTQDDLVIYLMLGSACFSPSACALNPSSVEVRRAETGIFARHNPDNPVRDWHHVFVPYCTGDVHAGANPDGGTIPGTVGQRFVGWTNIGLFLDRLVPTFGHVDRVLLTGSSAGGFGAAVNFDRTQQAFGKDVEVIMLDDAGTPLADEFSAPCLQQAWRDTWNLEETFLADCDACNAQPDGGGVLNYVTHLQDKYPDATLGHISHARDYTMRAFHGYGLDECAYLQNGELPTHYPPEMFEAGLVDLRDNWMTTDQWGTYYAPGEDHMFLLFPALYETEVDGVRLTDWLSDMLEGAPAHIGLQTG